MKKLIFIALLSTVSTLNFGQKIWGGYLTIIPDTPIIDWDYLVEINLYVDANEPVKDSIDLYLGMPKMIDSLISNDIRYLQYRTSWVFHDLFETVLYEDSISTKHFTNLVTSSDSTILFPLPTRFFNPIGDVNSLPRFSNDITNYQYSNGYGQVFLDPVAADSDSMKLALVIPQWLDSSFYYIPNGFNINANGFLSWDSQVPPGKYLLVVDVKNWKGIYRSWMNYSIVIEVDSTLHMTNTTLTKVGDSRFKLYPNPTSSQLTIEWQGSHKKLRLQLINAIGQVIYEVDDLQSNRHKIEMSEMAKGIYFVRLTDGQRQWTEKVLRW